MKFTELVNEASSLPFFTIGFLAAGEKLSQVRLQIARWVKDGRVVKIHKGLYQLAKPYSKIRPEKFSIANILKPHSYVSLLSALAYHDLIPEFVAEVTSITSGRPQTIETPLGRFDFRHVKKRLFNGFKLTEIASGQNAFIASPEKALLDLIYLTSGEKMKEFIEELRLQNLDKIDKKRLQKIANESGSRKLKRACNFIEKIINQGEGVEL